MSNPHKPWARIDSTLQRQLGHYSHYGMPADNLSVVTPEPASTLEYIIPEYWTDPRDYIAYPVYHFTPGEYPQAPNIALLSQNVQPDSVPAEPQPITTFGEGFKQAFDQWKNNYSYGYGRFLKNINYEDEIRYGLQALDENPELSRGNVQEINRSIKTLRRGIAERQNRIEAGEGTPEDEAAILKDSEKIRGLYAMQQQYYKGATPEEAEAWRNDYIAQGGTGTQRMAEAIEEQKNYRPTKGWGTVGSIGWEIPKTLITAAATRNPITAPFAILGGTGDAAIQNWARTNMQADLIEERTGEDVSTAQRLGQTALGAGVDIGTSLLLPMKGIRATQPFFNRLGKNIAAQGIAGGIGSASNDIGQNLILGDDLTAGEIASNALRGAAIGAMTGLGTTAVGHAMNKAGTRKIFREIPDESGMINGTTNALPDNRSIPDIGYYRFNRPIRVERSTLSPIVRNAIENEGLHIDNTPVRIPFATYRRGPLAAPGTYTRPYQNPGTIDPNGLRMIPRDEAQGGMSIPMDRYQLSYPLPEGMSNEPITIPQGRYGRGSSFWDENFRLSYPLPEGMDNTPVRIPFATYRRGPLAAPGTYTRPYQSPGTIDPNGLRMIPRDEAQGGMSIPMDRYQLSYPLPEGMSNEPITIPQGRYGRGSSFWGENFRLSYPLPEGMDNTPVRIPFATYRRGPLAAPGTYVRPYQNPGTIDPNGIRMIPRDEAQGGMSIPMDRYQLSYPLPEGMSNEPITIPQGRYGRGSSFWDENFRLSYPLPEGMDNTPVRIPFATYRRGPLAAPGTYTRPYQNPGTIDPNGIRMIPRDEAQGGMSIPMDRYQLSYPLPEGMSNEPITIPQGRYGRGSSFWGENFRLSYPLPEGMDNTPVRIPFATYRRGPLAAPGTYTRPYQNPGTIDPNGLRMIPRESDPNGEFSPGNGNLGREPETGASSSEANDTRTPFSAYEDMFGIDKLGDGDKKTKTQRGQKKKKK